jgi:hypothetical protein
MPTVGKGYSPCEIFGGKEVIASKIRETIKAQRESHKMSQKDLYVYSNLFLYPEEYSEKIVDDVESGKVIPDSGLAGTLLFPFRMGLCDLLPTTRQLTSDERDYWRALMHEGKAPYPCCIKEYNDGMIIDSMRDVAVDEASGI